MPTCLKYHLLASPTLYILCSKLLYYQPVHLDNENERIPIWALFLSDLPRTFSWLSAMLDASGSGGVVLVVMSPVKTGFSGLFFFFFFFFFIERTGFSNREQRKPVKTGNPVKPHPSTRITVLQPLVSCLSCPL